MGKWKSKVKYLLEVASDLSEVAIMLRDKPTKMDYASLGIRLISSGMNHYDRFSKNPLEDYQPLPIPELSTYFFNLLQTKFKYIYFESKSNEHYLFEDVYGEEIMFFGDKPYGPLSKDVDASMKALGRLVWETINSRYIELTKFESEDDVEIMFQKEDMSKIYPSKLANNILDRINLFLDKGYNRSAILYGQPGTGKTSVLRYIASQTQGMSLRVNVSNLDEINTDSIISCISLLSPDIVIIDDFDRVPQPNRFLSHLESINNKCKLFMITVNDVSKLGSAIIRPGRFDEIVEVKTIDPEITDRLIGEGIPDDIRKRLSEMPIAYITEFHKRKEVLGNDKAINEIEQLHDRIKLLNLGEVDEGESFSYREFEILHD